MYIYTSTPTFFSFKNVSLKPDTFEQSINEAETIFIRTFVETYVRR